MSKTIIKRNDIINFVGNESIPDIATLVKEAFKLGDIQIEGENKVYTPKELETLLTNLQTIK